MKTWKKLSLKFRLHSRLLRQRGQALVEFILLLVAIAGISFGFVTLMNRNLGKYWQYYANLIINDKPGQTTVRLK
jgi:hypothetical protein